MNFKKNWQLWLGGAGLLTIASVVIYRRAKHDAVLNKIDALIKNPNTAMFGDSRDLAASLGNVFSDTYWQGKTVSVYAAQAKVLGQKIADAVHAFTTNDDAAVIAVFKQLKYKADVSKLADTFNKSVTYNFMNTGDLLTFLKNHFTEETLQTITNIINQLP